MKVDVKQTPIKITYGGDLLAGSGVGASAAVCVSLARALNSEFNLGYTLEQINHVGWEGEFAYHGVPSGVDNTASTYGGLLLYWVKGEEKHFEKIVCRKPLHIVLGNSGVTANTALLDDYTAATIVDIGQEESLVAAMDELEQAKLSKEQPALSDDSPHAVWPDRMDHSGDHALPGMLAAIAFLRSRARSPTHRCGCAVSALRG
jgi:mevalonate kinase